MYEAAAFSFYQSVVGTGERVSDGDVFHPVVGRYFVRLCPRVRAGGGGFTTTHGIRDGFLVGSWVLAGPHLPAAPTGSGGEEIGGDGDRGEHGFYIDFARINVGGRGVAASFGNGSLGGLLRV